MSSLRERLLNRPRLSDVYPLRVEDDSVPGAALEEARAMLRYLQLQGQVIDPERLQAAKDEVAAAEAATAACYEKITLQAMTPLEFDALMQLHPPRAGSSDKSWNGDTFPRPCFLASVQSDLTEQEWERVLDTVLSTAEREDLFNAAIRVNVRVPDPSLPKGWTQTQS